MTIGRELLEAWITLLPLIVSVSVSVRRLPGLPHRVMQVIITATCGVLALGFMMQRLTLGCAPLAQPCPPETRAIAIYPALTSTFRPCELCSEGAEALSRAAFIVNRSIPFVSLFVAAACTGLSIASLVAFARWTRAHHRPRANEATPR